MSTAFRMPRAMEKFVAAERHYREHCDIYGVVLLIADDEETLRRTHARYFTDVEDMLSTFRDHASSRRR
ncbi:MAG: hypothetical protein ACXVHL_23420 [Solirubrobacteraceae bacterium]